MERTNWRQLCDRGPDLVLCLDFPGGRAVAGFADLAAAVPVEACFLHIEGVRAGPLAASADRWAAELTAAGRPVRAVLGFCAGAAIATRLADAIAGTAAAPPSTVVLIDADAVTGDSLATGFTEALESSAGHLTAGELADARDLAEQLAESYPDDLPRIAAALTDRYDQLMRAVADRLRLHEFIRKELTDGFTAYLDYLLLAAEGGFDTRTTTPLFLWSPGHEPLVEGARNITFETGHADLLRDPQVHKFVTDLLTGEHAW
ncbi:MAG: hypothetical protein JO345_22690 [Streptosporangiaceae bacterium]|nr:hypothetical protein [Streptosporangiaceae bacterium]